MLPIVVVGDGASGVLAAVGLADRGIGPVLMIGSSPEPGAGVAYRTCEPFHLLNSRAATMSVRESAPDDFVTWCAATGRPVPPTAFAPRRRYRGYLAARLDHTDVTVRPGRVVAVSPDGPHVLLADGGRVGARAVVLAPGHGSPVTPPVPGLAGPRYVDDPWRDGALETVLRHESVLLLGTGLTAVDVALAIGRHRPDATVHAVSRHGLLPTGHLPDPPAAAEPPHPCGSTRDLLAAVRRACQAGADWRGLVESLRAQANGIWATLSLPERQRFLRHVDRYWQVHRHRMAPPVAHAVATMRSTGALRVSAGRPERVSAERSGLAVTVRRRTVRCGVVVNCTGPGRWATGRDPLAVALRDAGLARLDSLGLGLACDEQGRLIDRYGRPLDWLWTLGPPRLGDRAETTAVPEIRAQASVLAATVTA